jgi:hypothetical protein
VDEKVGRAACRHHVLCIVNVGWAIRQLEGLRVVGLDGQEALQTVLEYELCLGGS